ncbi:MAG: Zinc transport protein ZntB [Halieaceae bacterium]|nr:MAG: Zinc transport protein ZntB [Halieaceae bacterium]
MITPSSSSTHGLIHALKLTQQGSASAVELTADGDATWLHFDAADPETSQWLLSAGGLNMVAASALTTEETRPRVLRRGDNLVLTLRGVNRLPGADAEDMVSLRIWTNGSRLISARLRPLQSTDRLVDELLSGEGANTIPGLLVDWVEYVVDDMADSIASLELDVAAAEVAIDDADPTSTRQSIVVLRKRALQFRRYMAPQREALSRLSTETPTWLDEYHRVRLRDIADRLMRYIEDLDQIRDRAILAQEELAARLADEMNHKTYVFTIVAVLFLPLGFLTGLLGVNVAGVPGVDEPQAFNYLIASCAAMMLALLAYFKWQRWM